MKHTAETDLALSRGFDAGNYANAYSTPFLDEAIPQSTITLEGTNEPITLEAAPDHVRAAFILGFFASYELGEIPGSDREAFDEAYFSDAGKRCVELGYCDSREDDHRVEGE